MPDSEEKIPVEVTAKKKVRRKQEAEEILVTAERKKGAPRREPSARPESTSAVQPRPAEKIEKTGFAPGGGELPEEEKKAKEKKERKKEEEKEKVEEEEARHEEEKPSVLKELLAKQEAAKKAAAQKAEKAAVKAAAEKGLIGALRGILVAAWPWLLLGLVIVAAIVTIALIFFGLQSKNLLIAPDPNDPADNQIVTTAAAITGKTASPMAPGKSIKEIFQRTLKTKSQIALDNLIVKLKEFGLTDEEINSLLSASGDQYASTLFAINQSRQNSGKLPLSLIDIDAIESALLTALGKPAPGETSALATPLPREVREALQNLTFRGKVVDLSPTDLQLVADCAAGRCELDYRLLTIMNFLAARHDYLQIKFKEGYSDENKSEPIEENPSYIGKEIYKEIDSPHYAGMAMDIYAIDYVDRKCRGFDRQKGQKPKDPIPVLCEWQVRDDQDLSAYNTERAKAQAALEESFGMRNLDWTAAQNPAGANKFIQSLGRRQFEEALGLPPDSFGLSQLSLTMKIGRRGLETDLNLPKGTFGVENTWEMLKYLGESIGLSQTLGMPLRRIHGYDLESLLITAGLAKMETELGLPEGALAELDSLRFSELKDLDKSGDFSQFWKTSFWETVRNLGQRYIENGVSFPPHSLDGNDVFQISTSIMLRQIEELFGLQNNSLRLDNLRDVIADISASALDDYLATPPSTRLEKELRKDWETAVQNMQTSLSFEAWLAENPSKADSYASRLAKMRAEEAKRPKWVAGTTQAIKNQVLYLIDRKDLNETEKFSAILLSAIILLAQFQTSAATENLDKTFGVRTGTFAAALGDAAFAALNLTAKTVTPVDYKEFNRQVFGRLVARIAAAKLARIVAEFGSVGAAKVQGALTNLKSNSQLEEERKALKKAQEENKKLGIVDNPAGFAFAKADPAHPNAAVKPMPIPDSLEEYKQQFKLVSQEDKQGELKEAIERFLTEDDFYYYLISAYDAVTLAEPAKEAEARKQMLKAKSALAQNASLQFLAEKLSFTLPVTTKEYERDPQTNLPILDRIPELDPNTGQQLYDEKGQPKTKEVPRLKVRQTEVTVRIYPSDILTLIDGNGLKDPQAANQARLAVLLRVGTQPLEMRLGLPAGTIDLLLSKGEYISYEIKLRIADELYVRYKIPHIVSFYLIAWIQGVSDLWGAAIMAGLDMIETHLAKYGLPPGTLTQFSNEIASLSAGKGLTKGERSAVFKKIVATIADIFADKLKPALKNVLKENLYKLKKATPEEIDAMYAEYFAANNIPSPSGFVIRSENLLTKEEWLKQNKITPVTEERIERAAQRITELLKNIFLNGLDERLADHEPDPERLKRVYVQSVVGIGGEIICLIFGWDDSVLNLLIDWTMAEPKDRPDILKRYSTQLACSYAEREVENWAQKTYIPKTKTTLAGLGSALRAILCDPQGKIKWQDVALNFGVYKSAEILGLEDANLILEAIRGERSWKEATLQFAVDNTIKFASKPLADYVTRKLVEKGIISAGQEATFKIINADIIASVIVWTGQAIYDSTEGRDPDYVQLGVIAGCAAFSYLPGIASQVAIPIPGTGIVAQYSSYAACALVVNLGRFLYNYLSDQLKKKIEEFNTRCYKPTAIQNIRNLTAEVIFEMNSVEKNPDGSAKRTPDGMLVVHGPTDNEGAPLIYSVREIITSDKIPDLDDELYGVQTRGGKTTGTYGHFRSPLLVNRLHIGVGENPLYEEKFESVSLSLQKK